MGRSNTSKRGPLPAPRVIASETTMTDFSGIVPLIRFMGDILDIPQRLVSIAGKGDRRRLFAIHLVLYAFLVGSLTGVHRLAHLEWLRGDPVLLKYLRLPRWPVRKVFSNALASVSDRGIRLLTQLICDVGLAPLVGRDSAVVDIDSSAIVTYGLQQGARFGYSGKGRNRRRHHPLVASVAETRTVVHADYRDGSGIAASEAIAFADRAIAAVRNVLATGARVVLRADSGFWSNAMGGHLLEAAVPFIFAMPLRPALKLMLQVTRWRGLDGDPDIQVTTLGGQRLSLDPRLRIVAIRRRVHDEKAPPQGKRIAGCTRWRYQALITNMDGVAEDLWRFYNGRSDCERVFKVARGALGMGRLVGQKLRANETAFLLRMLAFNADRRFHFHAEQRAHTEGREVLRMGLIARQRRFYRAAGRFLRAKSRWELRVKDGNPALQRAWDFYAPELVATG